MALSLNPVLASLSPSGIRRYSALAASTPGCISLALGEPSEMTPAPIISQAREDLAAGMTHYAPNNGSLQLRAAIARHMQDTQGLSYSAEDEVLLSCGATEALFVALTTLLQPGDEVIIPQPAFSLYASIVSLCGASCVPLDTSTTNFQINKEALRATITDKTKAIVITSPNNPTGCVLNTESLDIVAEAAHDSNFFVICDDVYAQLVYVDSFKGFAQSHHELRDRTIIVNSFSKSYAMCGWRLGWLAADAGITKQAAKVHQYAVSCLPTFTQNAAKVALSCSVSRMREAYHLRRDKSLAALEKMGLPVVKPDGAFYVFPSIKEMKMGSEEFCLRAIKQWGVALVPGTMFGCEGHVRLSYACSETTLETGLDRLAHFVDSLR
jgi:aminotransferase